MIELLDKDCLKIMRMFWLMVIDMMRRGEVAFNEGIERILEDYDRICAKDCMEIDIVENHKGLWKQAYSETVVDKPFPLQLLDKIEEIRTLPKLSKRKREDTVAPSNITQILATFKEGKRDVNEVGDGDGIEDESGGVGEADGAQTEEENDGDKKKGKRVKSKLVPQSTVLRKRD